MKKISKKRNEILKNLDLSKKHDPKEAIKYICKLWIDALDKKLDANYLKEKI